jgi:hypothetical protein
MSARLLATLPALADDELADIAYGLRETVEHARLVGQPGLADVYDALGALLDAERAHRAGRHAGPVPALTARLLALTNGELLALAVKTTTDVPPGASTAARAFLGALAALLNEECRRRVRGEAGGESNNWARDSYWG